MREERKEFEQLAEEAPEPEHEAIVVGNSFGRKEFPNGKPVPSNVPHDLQQMAELVTYEQGDTVMCHQETIADSEGVLRAKDEALQGKVESPYGVTDVAGIGRRDAEKLESISIVSLQDLADATAEEVASVVDASQSEAAEWIHEAEDLLSDAAVAEAEAWKDTEPTDRPLPDDADSLQATAQSGQQVSGEGEEAAEPTGAEVGGADIS